MGERLDLDAAARLMDAAEVLRDDAGDLRWLLEVFAARFEELLPNHVEVTREGVLRRRVRAISLQLGDQYFECRIRPDGGLETLTAPVRQDIVGRRHPLPVPEWVALMEKAIEREVGRTGDDRDALNRLLP